MQVAVEDDKNLEIIENIPMNYAETRYVEVVCLRLNIIMI